MNNLFNPPKFRADGSLNPVSKHKLSEFAVVFIDDILVFSSTAAEHKLHLQAVLSELHEHKVLIRASNCVRFKVVGFQLVTMQQSLSCSKNGPDWSSCYDCLFTVFQSLQ